ncbi:hypothetical protein GGR55DRAFT_170227 [Xylaria sp. FL0064]|nr:hypothetical protein GGR55DRAFT_170227 [Xylaria sp. FL0064]
MDCCSELLGYLLFQVIARSFASAMVIFADQLIVQRRGLIVRIGRRFQTIFHLPQCLCAFTAHDPGISKRSLRNSCFLIMFSLTISSLMALAICFGGAGVLRNPLVIGLSIINPIVCSLTVWIVLVITKQPGSSSSLDHMPSNLEKGTKSSEAVEDDDEAEVRNCINILWLAP